jgi:hypothetical protein
LIRGLDVSAPRTAAEKAAWLLTAEVKSVEQAKQLENPDAIVQLAENASGTILQDYADGMQGISSADFSRFGRMFYEVRDFDHWTFQQDAPDEEKFFSGRRYVISLTTLKRVAKEVKAYICGEKAWNQKGIAVAQMRTLARSVYSGYPTTDTVAIIKPHNSKYLLPIFTYCCSNEYIEELRTKNQKLNLNSAYLVKVPFDLDHWT